MQSVLFTMRDTSSRLTATFMLTTTSDNSTLGHIGTSVLRISTTKVVDMQESAAGYKICTMPELVSQCTK